MSIASCGKERKDVNLSWNRIPREEVEEIASCVLENLEAFIPNCEYTICGGSVTPTTRRNVFGSLPESSYRRGKTQSSDVDIVFRPPKDDQDIGLLRALYLRLSELGIVTHVLRELFSHPV